MQEGNKNYEKCKKVISINFITGNYERKNNELINTYELENKITHKILNNSHIELILVRLNRVDCINYNGKEERFIKWLRLINAKTLEELENIARGDKIMEEAIEYVTRYLNGPLNHTIEDYIVEKELEATERGEKIGIKQGMKQGILQTAKNLLNLNVNINDISKATGLSIK